MRSYRKLVIAATALACVSSASAFAQDATQNMLDYLERQQYQDSIDEQNRILNNIYQQQVQQNQQNQFWMMQHGYVGSNAQPQAYHGCIPNVGCW